MKSSPPPGPERPIGLLAALVARSVRQFVAAQVEPLGLSIQQFWAIVAVAENACSSQAELAARLHVDEATACRVVRALDEGGLVATSRDPGDRRRVRLQLAPAGEALARRLLPVAREVRGAIDTSLTADERASTRASLAKVLDRLVTLLEALPPASPAPPPAGRALPVRPRPAHAAARRRSAARNTSALRGRP